MIGTSSRHRGAGVSASFKRARWGSAGLLDCARKRSTAPPGPKEATSSQLRARADIRGQSACWWHSRGAFCVVHVRLLYTEPHRITTQIRNDITHLALVLLLFPVIACWALGYRWELRVIVVSV